MSKRVFITAGIIIAIGAGTGSLLMGLLLINHPNYDSRYFENAAYVAIGGGIMTGGIAALIAHLHGAFKSLDEHDDDRL
jgi:hypothetical protein